MRSNLQSKGFFGALSAGVMMLALAAAFSFAPPAEAKPPGGGGGGGGGGGEPVPGGAFYFVEGDIGILRIFPDGSGLAPALPISASPYPEPSHLLYGSGDGHRLWLRAEPTGQIYDIVDGSTSANVTNRDIFVYREDIGSDESDHFQLTGLYGQFLVQDQLRFSNDGQDSFVSFKGIDLRNDGFYVDSEGKTHLVAENLVRGIFRIQITGSDIDAGAWVADGSVVETIVTGGTGYESNYEHGWSADGTKVAFILYDGQNEDLNVTDLSGETPTTTKIFEGSYFTQHPRFSPVSDTLSFHSQGDVWTINADGSGAAVLLPKTPPTHWSPDGNHMCFTEIVIPKGFKPYEYYLTRVSLNSGTRTRVTGGTSHTAGKAVLPWVSTNFPL